MNARLVFLLVLVAALAAAAGWFAARRGPAADHGFGTARAAAPDGAAPRKVLFYQSPMHPWIKSDRPGKCTICGMDLVPVYEGDAGFSASADLVTLRPSSIQVVGVQTEPARRAPLARTLLVAGTIDDDDTRHRIVASYVEGRIDRLFVNYVGAEIGAGQPLALLYSPVLLTAQQEFVALLARRATAATADREFLDRLIAAGRARLLRLGLTEAQVDALRPDTTPAVQTEIVAPLGGTVITRLAYEGQYVREGESLFEIGDFARMWFVFDVYENDLPWVRAGQAVTVSTPARPGETAVATIDFIDPNLEPATRSAKVRAVLDNPVVEAGPPVRRRFDHGLYAQGRVALDAPVVLTVPRRAVLNTGGEAVVFVDRGGGAYERRPVRLGRVGDTHLEVLGGLAEGEAVVTEGNLILDGQAQLNLQVAGSPAPAPAAPAEAGDPAEITGVPEFVAALAAATEALAADNLPGYVAARPRLVAALRALPAAPADVARLADALTDGPDLTAARRPFEPFSTAAADWLKPLRARHADTLRFRLYECPMTPVLGTGRWIQLDAPLRNPFFGAEMLECGLEVR